eukprot:jgi/Chrzof1/10943/Cz05g18050.t1
MIGGQYIESDIQRKILLHELGVIKIADFGLSKSLKIKKQEPELSEAKCKAPAGPTPNGTAPTHTPSYKLTGETGSYRYMAPEVFRHELYNHKVDQYAFAMIAFQLFEGTPPFWALDPVTAARAAATEGTRPQWGAVNRYSKKVPDRLKQLVERCWSANYDLRPEFTEVVAELEQVLADLPRETPIASHGNSGCCAVQ